MKKIIGALMFTPWLFLGISPRLEPPESATDFAAYTAIHLAFIALLVLIVRRARVSDKGTCLGYSAGFWVTATITAYALGFFTPELASQ